MPEKSPDRMMHTTVDFMPQGQNRRGKFSQLAPPWWGPTEGSRRGQKEVSGAQAEAQFPMLSIEEHGKGGKTENGLETPMSYFKDKMTSKRRS